MRATMVREDDKKVELSTVKGKLVAGHVECAILRWDRNEMVSRAQQAEVDVNEALNAVPTSLASMCAQMCSVGQAELENAFRQIWEELELEAKREMANAQVALERDNANVDCDVAQCAVLLRN